MARFTVSSKKELPQGFVEVKDLVRFVRTLDTKVWTQEDVFQTIKAITVEQLGVKESAVTLEANFVKDLGAG